MAPERVERKLSTVIAVGVEGYSLLMRADDQDTLKTLGDYRKIIDTLIIRHDGRVSQGILLSKYHSVGQIATG